MAVTADGTVYSCGNNRAGTLGTGDTLDRSEPVRMVGVNLRVGKVEALKPLMYVGEAGVLTHRARGD